MSSVQLRHKWQNKANFCNCGSNKHSWWHFDARGIELFKGCEDCEKEKLKQYRPEVLVDPNYECCEDVDED